jgi:hypothetical protein
MLFSEKKVNTRKAEMKQVKIRIIMNIIMYLILKV